MLLNPHYHQALRVSCAASHLVTKIHKLRVLHLGLGTGQVCSRWSKEAMSQGMQLPNLHWGRRPVGAVRLNLHWGQRPVGVVRLDLGEP